MAGETGVYVHASLYERADGGDEDPRGFNTAICVAPDGTQSQIATGFEQVRGTAYDSAGHRLFVVEHAKSGPPTLHVLPL